MALVDAGIPSNEYRQMGDGRGGNGNDDLAHA